MLEKELEVIIKEYGDFVFRSCYLCIGDYDLARDAVQETFIKVYLKYDTLKNKEAEKSWIYKIALNESKQIMRRKYFNIERVEESCECLFEKYISDSECNYADTLNEAIIKLSPKLRYVIVAYYYNELSIKEISSALGVSENVVLQRLRRGRLKLKDILVEKVELV